jgi:hypothetical protein
MGVAHFPPGGETPSRERLRMLGSDASSSPWPGREGAALRGGGRGVGFHRQVIRVEGRGGRRIAAEVVDEVTQRLIDAGMEQMGGKGRVSRANGILQGAMQGAGQGRQEILAGRLEMSVAVAVSGLTLGIGGILTPTRHRRPS